MLELQMKALAESIELNTAATSRLVTVIENASINTATVGDLTQSTIATFDEEAIRNEIYKEIHEQVTRENEKLASDLANRHGIMNDQIRVAKREALTAIAEDLLTVSNIDDGTDLLTRLQKAAGMNAKEITKRAAEIEKEKHNHDLQMAKINKAYNPVEAEKVVDADAEAEVEVEKAAKKKASAAAKRKAKAEAEAEAEAEKVVEVEPEAEAEAEVEADKIETIVTADMLKELAKEKIAAGMPRGDVKNYIIEAGGANIAALTDEQRMDVYTKLLKV